MDSDHNQVELSLPDFAVPAARKTPLNLPAARALDYFDELIAFQRANYDDPKRRFAEKNPQPFKL